MEQVELAKKTTSIYIYILYVSYIYIYQYIYISIYIYIYMYIGENCTAPQPHWICRFWEESFCKPSCSAQNWDLIMFPRNAVSEHIECVWFCEFRYVQDQPPKVLPKMCSFLTKRVSGCPFSIHLQSFHKHGTPEIRATLGASQTAWHQESATWFLPGKSPHCGWFSCGTGKEFTLKNHTRSPVRSVLVLWISITITPPFLCFQYSLHPRPVADTLW